MKRIYCLMILICPLLSWCQRLTPLTIGDMVPDLTITDVHNYKTGSFHLSSLKGEAVIIDFWASWCGSCIATFPELEKLQKEFKGHLKIIMVNDYYPDSNEKIKEFLEKREKRTEMPFTLTYALRDTVLRLLFPYRQIPHDVWIDATGKVAAITGYEAVNEDNLSAFLKNGSIELPVKDDSRMFNRTYPLLEGKNGDSSFLYRSVITGFKDGLGCPIGQEADAGGMISRVYMINSPLLALLEKAYPKVFSVSLSRMIFKGDSTIKNLITRPHPPVFCYELITRPSTPRRIQTQMQQDLCRWFGVSARNDPEPVKCYVLKMEFSPHVTKSGPAALDVEPETARKIFTRQPISSLTTLLERITHKTIIDETGFKGTLDLDVPRNIYDFSIDQISGFLEKNGFKMVPAIRKMKAIVIEEQ